MYCGLHDNQPRNEVWKSSKSLSRESSEVREGAHLFILFSCCLWTYLNVCVFVCYHQLQVTEGSGPRGMIKRFLGLPPPLPPPSIPPPPATRTEQGVFTKFTLFCNKESIQKLSLQSAYCMGLGGEGTNRFVRQFLFLLAARKTLAPLLTPRH
jgi:hypothetical protein